MHGSEKREGGLLDQSIAAKIERWGKLGAQLDSTLAAGWSTRVLAIGAFIGGVLGKKVLDTLLSGHPEWYSYVILGILLILVWVAVSLVRDTMKGMGIIKELLKLEFDHSVEDTRRLSQMDAGLGSLAHDVDESVTKNVPALRATLIELARDIRVLKKRSPLNIEYHDCSAENEKMQLYEELVDLIKDEETTKVWALGSYRPDVEGSGTLAKRREYFDALIAKCKTATFEYQRKCQIEIGSDATLDGELRKWEQNRDYWEHFRAILNAQKDPSFQTKPEIHFYPAKRYTTFLIINGTVLVWQINEKRIDGQHYMRGVFVFRDEKHQIVPYFERHFLEFTSGEELSQNTQILGRILKSPVSY